MTSLFHAWQDKDKQHNLADVPLFDVPEAYSNRTIQIADGPLNSNPSIVEVACSEVSAYLTKNFGSAPFTWVESLLGPTTLNELYPNELPNKRINNFYSSGFSNAFSLCYLGDELGLGLFATMDIPADTCIGIYAGAMQQTKYNDEGISDIDMTDTYQLQLSKRRDYFVVKESLNEKKLPIAYVTANLFGNMTRFLQSLPTKEMIEETFLTDVGAPIVSNIATQNVVYKYVTHYGMPAVSFVTTEPVKKNQQLGFYYGESYFPARNMVMKYFDKAVGNELNYEIISFFNKGKFLGNLEGLQENYAAPDQLSNIYKGILSLLKLYHQQVLQLPQFNNTELTLFLAIYKEYNLNKDDPTYKDSHRDSALVYLIDMLDLSKRLNLYPEFYSTLDWQITKSSSGKFVIGSKLTTSSSKDLNIYCNKLKQLGLDTEIVEEGKKQRRLVIKDVAPLPQLMDMINLSKRLNTLADFFPTLNWQVTTLSSKKSVVASKLVTTAAKTLDYYSIKLKRLGVDTEVIEGGNNSRRLVIKDTAKVQEYLLSKQVETLNIGNVPQSGL